jgi:acetyl esterase/lipase
MAFEELLEHTYQGQDFKAYRQALRALEPLKSASELADCQSVPMNETEFWDRLEANNDSDDPAQLYQSPCYRRYMAKRYHSKKTIFYVPSSGIAYETAITDYVCSYVAAQHQCQVIALYPRLAPEHSPETIRHDIESMFRHCIDKSPQMGIEPYNIEFMGHGFGALQCLQLAATHQLRATIQKLWLIDPILTFNPDAYAGTSYLSWAFRHYFCQDKPQDNALEEPIHFSRERRRRLPYICCAVASQGENESYAKPFLEELKRNEVPSRMVSHQHSNEGLLEGDEEALSQIVDVLFSRPRAVEHLQAQQQRSLPAAAAVAVSPRYSAPAVSRSDDSFFLRRNDSLPSEREHPRQVGVFDLEL